MYLIKLYFNDVKINIGIYPSKCANVDNHHEDNVAVAADDDYNEDDSDDE